MPNPTVMSGIPSESNISEGTRSGQPQGVSDNHTQGSLSEPLSDDRSDATQTEGMSSIQQLPPELLQAIFLYAFSTKVEDFHRRKHGIIRESHLFPSLPMELSHVCVLWKTLAYATPELWSLLGVKIANVITPHSTLPDILEDWLTRSGTYPITISLSARRPGTRICLAKIGLFSQRWLDVHFRMQSELLDAFADLDASDVPLLESFDIHDESGVTTLPSLSGPMFLKNAPALHTAGIPLRALSFLQIPNSQLTTLMLRQFPLDYALGIIRKSPNLECLHLATNTGRSNFWSVPFGNVNTIEMRQLRELHIEGAVGPLLVFLRCPNLHRVRISGNQPSPDVSSLIDIFNDLLRDSNCYLRDMSFRNVSFLENRILNCFRFAPTLESLCLDTCPPAFARSVIKTLTVSPNDPLLLCPHLCRIEIRESGIIPQDIISQFLISRCQTSDLGRMNNIKIFNSTTAPLSAILRELISNLEKRSVNVVIISKYDSNELEETDI